MNQKQFLNLIRPELQEAKVKIKINSTAYCNGCFDSSTKILEVNSEGDFVYQTLIHEYCHFKQWKERKTFWNSCTKGACIFFDWLDGNDICEKKLINALSDVLELELDCERRSLELIKKLDLDVNPYLYTIAANACLFSYLFICKYRNLAEDLYQPSILRMMPGKLLSLEDYLDENNLSSNTLNLYNKIFSQN